MVDIVFKICMLDRLLSVAVVLLLCFERYKRAVKKLIRGDRADRRCETAG